MQYWFLYTIRFVPTGQPSLPTCAKSFMAPLHLGEKIEHQGITYVVTEIIHNIEARPFVVAKQVT